MGTKEHATCISTSGGHLSLQMADRFLRLFAGHGNHVRCMAFLGSKVISGSDDRTIRV
jgi:hypothetical protein